MTLGSVSADICVEMSAVRYVRFLSVTSIRIYDKRTSSLQLFLHWRKYMASPYLPGAVALEISAATGRRRSLVSSNRSQARGPAVFAQGLLPRCERTRRNSFHLYQTYFQVCHWRCWLMVPPNISYFYCNLMFVCFYCPLVYFVQNETGLSLLQIVSLLK